MHLALVALAVGVATSGLAVVAASPAYAAGVTASFSKDSDWGTGYQGKFTITNGSSSTISSWNVQWDLGAGLTMGSYWDALVSTSGQHVTATNRTYNGTVAPGASVTFGFLVNGGSGAPTNCTVNGASCAGGTSSPSASPTASRTTSPSPSPSTSTPPPPASLPVAPYVDMGAWPSPVLTDMATGGNLKNFTLAFVTAVGCKASWFNAYDPRAAWAKDQIDAIRARGGDVKISFGGASGQELAQACTSVAALQAEYQAVVTAYGLHYVDFDIEGAAVADTAANTRRSQALKNLQAANPGLKVSLTLPVLPEGLTAEGVAIVQSARDAGVTLDIVNVMAMDYYRTGDYGDLAVQAANSTFSQLKTLYPSKTDAQLWRMVGVTPMLGANDDGHIYDQNDARQMVTFANGKHLGMLAFWEEGRDKNACNGALYMCTNIAQAPYEFSKIFAAYAG
ncbi:cellulose binding domain-containing protein [Hamadaea tsunoensis]|uniref:cellulose binding domain-containing protein n=1 Tax=Hamadaea tsunoensis TaxID=53368 RepID=UPI00041B0A5A|nr:cellulose binding domain-containing protein [Hamadaea tsunoensis]